MTRFLNDAAQILEAAESGTDPEIAILIDDRAGIRIVSGRGDWPLESLRQDAGAQVAYRVRRENGEVRVEGRSSTETCLLRRQNPRQARWELFGPSWVQPSPNPPQCGSNAIMLLT